MPSYLSFDELKQFYICSDNKLKQSELLFQFLANLTEDSDVVKMSILVITESLLDLTAIQVLELNSVCNLFSVGHVECNVLLYRLMNCPTTKKYLQEEYYMSGFLENWCFHKRRYEASKDPEANDTDSNISDTSNILKDTIDYLNQ
jgi:hypothetical protein